MSMSVINYSAMNVICYVHGLLWREVCFEWLWCERALWWTCL